MTLRGRAGDRCTLSPYDAGPGVTPAAGMFVVTEAGSAYLIERATRVRSQSHPWRWRLDVTRFDIDSIPEDAERLWLHWYRRDRSRR